MTDPTVPETEESTDPADASSMGVARVRHFIELNERADRDEFERLMLHDIFGRVDTQEEGAEPGSSDEHALLGQSDFGTSYVWEIRMLYFIHQTALPVWLTNRADKSFELASDDIGRFAQRTSSEVFFDVREWRQARGLE